MKLQPIYESQDDIPEAYRDLYSEQGGKWVLTGIDGLKTQADIDAVKEARRKEAQRADDAEAKLKKFRGLDPDDVHAKLDEFDALRAKADGRGDDEEAIQKRVDAEVKKHTAPLQRKLDQEKEAREAAEAKAQELDGTIKRSRVEAEIQKAAASAKVRPEAVEDLLLHRDAFELDDEGKVITKDGVGVTPGVGPDVWISDMKEKRPHWWPDAQGAGARGSDGTANFSDNPYRSGNATKISQLVQASPEKADQMARAAGFDGHDDAAKKGFQKPAA